MTTKITKKVGGKLVEQTTEAKAKQAVWTTEMRYQAKHKNGFGEIITQLVDGDNWATVVNSNQLTRCGGSSECSKSARRAVKRIRPDKNTQKIRVGPNDKWRVESIVGE